MVIALIAMNIENNTRGQSKCKGWKTHRKIRFTAFNFGKVCKRRIDVNDAFHRSIQGRDLQGVCYVRLRFNKEEDLGSLFMRKKTFTLVLMSWNVTLQSAGLTINSAAPHLGASIDIVSYPIWDLDQSSKVTGSGIPLRWFASGWRLYVLLAACRPQLIL